MASNVEISGNLTNYQYVRLGQSISCSSMESVALGYLNIDEEKIRNLKAARRDDTEGFVRRWFCERCDQRMDVSKSYQPSAGENILKYQHQHLGAGNL